MDVRGTGGNEDDRFGDVGRAKHAGAREEPFALVGIERIPERRIRRAR